MKVLKRTSIIFVLLASLFCMTSCKKLFSNTLEKEKIEVGSQGITITLDKTFVEQSNVLFAFFYASNTYGVAGNCVNKEQAVSYANVYNIDQYWDTVISEINTKGVIKESGEKSGKDNKNFKYAYYEATIEGRSFVYLTTAKEGSSKYCVVNIWCENKNYNDKTKEKMMGFAETIVVE